MLAWVQLKAFPVYFTHRKHFQHFQLDLARKYFGILKVSLAKYGVIKLFQSPMKHESDQKTALI